MPRKTSRFWKIALSVLCIVWSFIIAGWAWQDHKLSDQENQLREIIAKLVASNPDFDLLHPTRSSHPKVWIFGQLRNQDQIELLSTNVAAQFGVAEADRIVRVVVAPGASSQPAH
jgi:hypothetical protein